MFWFSDGKEQLAQLNEGYFALGNLLNRLLNESYSGKKIKFINIYFRTEETYSLFPQASKNHLNFYKTQISYDDVFDLLLFNGMKDDDQNRFIWKRACEILKESSELIKNDDLFNASEYAYKRGIEIDLNPDYRMLENNVMIYGKFMTASVWVNFKKDGMYSKFTLEKDGMIVFEKFIDRTKNGIEFFLEMYKSVEAKGNIIVIKGQKGVDYLPLEILIEKEIIDIV